jgi:hypothetical protein
MWMMLEIRTVSGGIENSNHLAIEETILCEI